jgi:hypothetical protein
MEPNLLAKSVIATAFVPFIRRVSRRAQVLEPLPEVRGVGPIGVRWRSIILSDPCPYCGEELSCTLDHIDPASKGGVGSWYNLAGACEVCNRRKGSMSLLLFVLKRTQIPAPGRAGKSSRNKMRAKLDAHRNKLAILKSQRYDLFQSKLVAALRGE